LIVHNIGRGPELQDALFDYKIIGHFRYAGRAAGSPAIHPHPIVTERRLELTRRYCKTHYGIDSSRLIDPQIVVVHATEIATLEATLKSFEPDTIDPGRGYLNEHGGVNVGVHFVVDRNGDIYSLLPLEVIGRHAIGLNHVSVGIENVGFSDKLTKEQVDADAALIADLAKRLRSLKYVIGHHEYVDRKRPHYVLYRELDPKYAPTQKSDPGPAFMSSLRRELSRRGLGFMD
jgi:N-acetyl-anhydromuramyl-L-alanine amidase AmpD